MSVLNSSFNVSSIAELNAICLSAIESGLTPLVFGPPGIGKTQFFKKLSEELDFKNSNFIHLECSQIVDGETITGIPYVSDGNLNIFNIFLDKINKKEKVFVFVDEVTNISPLAIGSIYSLILEKRFGRDYLPEGSIVVSAGNPEEFCSVYTMNSTLSNRLLVINYEGPTAEEWLNFFRKSPKYDVSIDFLVKKKPTLLKGFDPEKLSNPTPRSLENLGGVVKNARKNPKALFISILPKIISGCIGAENAAEAEYLISLEMNLPSSLAEIYSYKNNKKELKKIIKESNEESRNYFSININEFIKERGISIDKIDLLLETLILILDESPILKSLIQNRLNKITGLNIVMKDTDNYKKLLSI